MSGYTEHITPSLTGLTETLASPVFDGRAAGVVKALQQLMDAWHAAGWLPHPLVLTRATKLAEGAFAQVLPYTSGDVKWPHPMCIALNDTGHFPLF